ncbi:uncharacterized protein LOC108135212 [Drosophila elegans]|uniref:uncharacterized protein LOC108135212 n=1 Tax=Drosophila elegans TaxID=30023 RepID=UPI0007E6126B|nr:uncharacterized protein LOC108135212 [Drosophila elegans]
MTSPLPILLACFVHLMLNTTLFIQMDPDHFADTPIVGSQIFYLSLMVLLGNCEVTPARWKYVPPWGKFILETIVIFLIGEIAMVGIWLSMETLLVELTINGLKWTGLACSKMLILEIGTLVLGITFAVIVAAITNRPAKVQQIGRQMWITFKTAQSSSVS